MGRRSPWKRVLLDRSLDVLTYVVVLLALCPVLWLALTAFKTRADAFAMPPVWLFTPTLANFQEVFQQTSFYEEYLNSIIVASNTTALALLIGLPAAYALTRFQFRFKRGLAFWILNTRLVPPIGVLFPLYVIFDRLGLLDTYAGLMVLYLSFTLAFVIWMMRGYLMQVPVELEEAAYCDGATRVGALVRIVLPLVVPGITAVAILTFVACWNEFMYALIFTRMTARTAPVAIVGFMSFEGINWGSLAAAGLAILAPVYLLSIFAVRYLVTGLSMGVVKD